MWTGIMEISGCQRNSTTSVRRRSMTGKRVTCFRDITSLLPVSCPSICSSIWPGIGYFFLDLDLAAEGHRSILLQHSDSQGLTSPSMALHQVMMSDTHVLRSGTWATPILFRSGK